jgi:hypothetical protein
VNSRLAGRALNAKCKTCEGIFARLANPTFAGLVALRVIMKHKSFIIHLGLITAEQAGLRFRKIDKLSYTGTFQNCILSKVQEPFKIAY